MLTISNKQLTTFRARNGGSFEQQLIAHLREFAPHQAKALGDEGLRKVIRYGMERAESHGFTMRGPSRFYLETMFMFGSEFDSDPQYPWAFAALSAHGSGDEVERADALHAQVMSYVAAARGPGMLQRAFERARITLARPLPQYEGRFQHLLMAWARAVYPEKFRFAGEAAVCGLAEQSLRRSRFLDFNEEPAAFLLFVLAYLLGHGCASDPQFPWVAASLAPPDPAGRYRRLLEATQGRLARTSGLDAMA